MWIANNKKFISVQFFFPHTKPFQRAGGYRIGFFVHIVHPYQKSILPTQSRWLLNYSSMYISNEQKTTPIFHIFQFYIRRTPQISHWTITAQHRESTIFENTRRISHKMMINYPRNPYDENDSRS